jgi:hypothetical protein
MLGDTPKPQLLLFFGAKKRSKRSIHPNQTFPYIGRLKKIIAETDDYFYVLVKRDDALILL